MGCEEKEHLEVTSVQYLVKVHKRHKYACRGCGETIRLAPAPPEAIEKGSAGPHLLAQVMTDKYVYHLPLYRQQQRFLFQGLSMSRATLWNWIYLSAISLAPLVEAMKAEMLATDHLFSDDTPIRTLRSRHPEQKRKGAKKNTMWVYTGFSHFHRSPIVVYDYASSRASLHPASFLQGFQGYLQTDAYSGYFPLTKGKKNREKNRHEKGSIIPLGCWAHVRRKFMEALMAQPSSFAQEMVDKIGKLYEVERMCKEKNASFSEIKTLRQEKSKPVIEAIYAWLALHHPHIPPKSLLGKAMHYAQAHKDSLKGYLEDGRLEIDNNRSERCIKSIVMGRKNYLFLGSEKGGYAAAIVYSLAETCKQNGVDPLKYFADVLQRIPTHLNKHIHELLPYHWKTSQENQTHALKTAQPP